jgi:hypothetical protein
MAARTRTNGLMDYVRAAFGARPAGMFVPPNWIGVGAMSLLGVLVNPGFLVLGLGLELGYLFAVANNARFQRVVDGRTALAEREKERVKAEAQVRRLSPESQKRLERLQRMCESVLETHSTGHPHERSLLDSHADSLNRFVWIFFQLLLTREGILSLEKEGKLAPETQRRLVREAERIQEELAQPDLSPELSRSLQGKLDILRQRMANLTEGEQKLEFVESELSRVEQQVELMRERALVQRDSGALSSQIDLVGSSLGETAEWIRTQRSLFAATEDLSEEAPPLLARARGAHEES